MAMRCVGRVTRVGVMRVSARRRLGTTAGHEHKEAHAPHAASDHHDDHHDDHHNHDAPQFPPGHLFGEVTPPGTKRVREDWELIYYFGMGGAFVLAIVGLWTKPQTKPSAWARAELIKREADAAAEKQ